MELFLFCKWTKKINNSNILFFTNNITKSANRTINKNKCVENRNIDIYAYDKNKPEPSSSDFRTTNYLKGSEGREEVLINENKNNNKNSQDGKKNKKHKIIIENILFKNLYKEKIKFYEDIFIKFEDY